MGIASDQYEMAMEQLISVETMFSPLRFLYDSKGGFLDWVTEVLSAGRTIGLTLFALCVLSRIAYIYFSGLRDVSLGGMLLGAAVEICIVGAILLSYDHLVLLIPKAFSGATGMIFDAVDEQLTNMAADAFAMIREEKTSAVGWFSCISCSVMGAFSAIVAGLAMALFFWNGYLFGGSFFFLVFNRANSCSFFHLPGF